MSAKICRICTQKQNLKAFQQPYTVKAQPPVTADIQHKIPSLTGSHWGKHHPRPFRGGHIKVAFPVNTDFSFL